MSILRPEGPDFRRHRVPELTALQASDLLSKRHQGRWPWLEELMAQLGRKKVESRAMSHFLGFRGHDDYDVI